MRKRRKKQDNDLSRKVKHHPKQYITPTNYFSGQPFDNPIAHNCRKEVVTKYYKLCKELITHFEDGVYLKNWELTKLKRFKYLILKQHYVSNYAMGLMDTWQRYSLKPEQNREEKRKLRFEK